MRALSIVFIINLISISQVFSQPWQWTAHTGTSFGSPFFYDIATDSESNSYVVGRGNTTFGTTSTKGEGFVVKYDHKGNYVWHLELPIIAYSIDVDNASNVYVGGYFTGTINIPGLTSMTSKSFNYDNILVKLNNQGTPVWARTGGGLGVDGTNDLKVDTINNFIYITGTLDGSGTFGTTNLTGIGKTDLFLAKYDLNGNLKWVKNGGSTSDDITRGLNLGIDGSIYISGSFVGTATFGSVSLTSTNFNNDGFILKYNSSGDAVWGKSYGGSLTDDGYGIAIDRNNQLYVVGAISGNSIIGDTTLKAHFYDSDILISKWDAEGNFDWARLIANDTWDEQGKNVIVDFDDNIVVSGEFRGAFKYDTITFYSSGGPADGTGFIAKINSDGQIMWGRSVKGASRVSSLSVDKFNNIYVAGDMNGNGNIEGNNISPGAFVVKFGSPVILTNTDYQVKESNLIFPNPSENYIILENAFKEKTEFELYDLKGRKLLSEIVGDPMQTINLSSIETGIYFYKLITTDSIVGEGKLIKK